MYQTKTSVRTSGLTLTQDLFVLRFSQKWSCSIQKDLWFQLSCPYNQQNNKGLTAVTQWHWLIRLP